MGIDSNVGAAGLVGEVARWFTRRAVSAAPAGCGVLTACDSAYFPGVQMLVCSLRGLIPIAVVDLGLDDVQLGWLRARGAQIAAVPAENWVAGRSVSMWQTWNKPTWCMASPFECTLWLDADTLVVGDLAEVWQLSAVDPLLIAHPDNGREQSRNPDVLYDALPVKQRLAHGAVQAGVIGLPAATSRRLLDRWAWCVSRVFKNTYPHTTACWDQGALLWAAERLELCDRVLSPAGVNRFVFISDHVRRLGPVVLLDSLPLRADDVVVHLADRWKYWSDWGSYVAV